MYSIIYIITSYAPAVTDVYMILVSQAESLSKFVNSALTYCCLQEGTALDAVCKGGRARADQRGAIELLFRVSLLYSCSYYLIQYVYILDSQY